LRMRGQELWGWDSVALAGRAVRSSNAEIRARRIEVEPPGGRRAPFSVVRSGVKYVLRTDVMYRFER
jgi:hypothetical protein